MYTAVQQYSVVHTNTTGTNTSRQHRDEGSSTAEMTQSQQGRHAEHVGTVSEQGLAQDLDAPVAASDSTKQPEKRQADAKFADASQQATRTYHFATSTLVAAHPAAVCVGPTAADNDSSDSAGDNAAGSYGIDGEGILGCYRAGKPTLVSVVDFYRRSRKRLAEPRAANLALTKRRTMDPVHAGAIPMAVDLSIARVASPASSPMVELAAAAPGRPKAHKLRCPHSIISYYCERAISRVANILSPRTGDVEFGSESPPQVALVDFYRRSRRRCTADVVAVAAGADTNPAKRLTVVAPSRAPPMTPVAYQGLGKEERGRRGLATQSTAKATTVAVGCPTAA